MTSKTFIPAMPQCYIELWFEIKWPEILKKYGGNANKSSILSAKVASANTELERWRKFGPAWSWMALSEAARQQEWQIQQEREADG